MSSRCLETRTIPKILIMEETIKWDENGARFSPFNVGLAREVLVELSEVNSHFGIWIVGGDEGLRWRRARGTKKDR